MSLWRKLTHAWPHWLPLLPPLALYAATVSRTVNWYDSAEFAAHAATFTIPHPPGYPVYIALAHLATKLPGEAALNTNLLTVACSLGALLLLSHLARACGMSHAAAALAVLTLACAPTFWANTVVTEVYTPGLACTLGVLALQVAGVQRQRPHFLLGAALLAGLGVGVHMSIATVGLGFVWLTAAFHLPKGARWPNWPQHRWARLRTLLQSPVAVALGLLAFILVPARAENPWSHQAWVHMAKNMAGGAFRRRMFAHLDLSERIHDIANIFVHNLTWVGCLGALLGARILTQRAPTLALAVLLGALGNVAWFSNYDVPDLDCFFVPSLALACLCFGQLFDLTQRVPTWLRAGLFAVPVWLAMTHAPTLSRRNDREAARYGAQACAELQTPSVLVHMSRPHEWRRYSVLLYMQHARSLCEGVTFLNKPTHAEIMAKLRAGLPTYVLAADPPYTRRFVVTRQGVLFRLTLRQPVHHTAP